MQQEIPFNPFFMLNCNPVISQITLFATLFGYSLRRCTRFSCFPVTRRGLAMGRIHAAIAVDPAGAVPAPGAYAFAVATSVAVAFPI